MEQADSGGRAGPPPWRNRLGGHHSYPANARSRTTETVRDCVRGGLGAVRTSATGDGRLRSAADASLRQGGDPMRNQPERKSPTENLEHASIRQYCKAVRTPAIGANFVSLAEQAVKENQTHILYLEALLALECEERDRHAIENRTRDAQLPRMKTLEEFDFAQAPQIPAAKIRELAEGSYLYRIHRSVPPVHCVTGKSHLATG